PGVSRYGVSVMPGLRERFATLVAAPSCTLDRAALEIARIGHPDLDPTPTLGHLDALADDVRPRLTRAPPAPPAPPRPPRRCRAPPRPPSLRGLRLPRQSRRLLRPAQQLPERRRRAADPHPDP